LNGIQQISDAMWRTLKWIWIPGQQARVAVPLGGLLGILIDYLGWNTLERARFVLGRFTAETGLGLPVDYRWDWGEFGVVGVIDGLDSVLFLELIDGERRMGGEGSDAFRTRWRVWNSFFL
jgi:hypothetical protein